MSKQHSDSTSPPRKTQELAKEFYLHWKDKYDGICWLSSYPTWDNLGEFDQKFWSEFVDFTTSKVKRSN